MSYYYTCGVHRETNLATCIRSESGFQEFDKPHEYKQKTQLLLEKTMADAKLPTTPMIGLKQFLTDFEPTETRILCAEMKAPYVEIVKK
jgi:hypothetical protein